jgi:hypothetical protein
MIKRLLLPLLALLAPLALGAAEAPAPAAAAPAAAAPASAATNAANARNSYRVEVIIFRPLQPPGGSEDYSAKPEERGFNDKRDEGNGPPTVLRQLEDSELQLNAVAQKIHSNGSMQILVHKGWIQTATAWGRHVGLPLDQFGIDVPNLRGTLYLERGDLLHFGAWLQFGTAPVYTLSELRKVRLNEKHYLDHPALGVVVQVAEPYPRPPRTGS